ncbi:MAG: Ig-like domain-containing protein, partial [Myxococcota bacterium]
PLGDHFLDADGDTVPDACDVCPGFDDRIDLDLDGVPQGCDICPGFDDAIDSDGDGIPDGCDTNSPPTVVTPGPLTVANDSQITTTIQATDPDGDPLFFSLGTLPANGTVSLATATGVLTYTPNPGFVGTDSFVVQVTDGLTTVSVTVNIVITAP